MKTMKAVRQRSLMIGLLFVLLGACAGSTAVAQTLTTLAYLNGSNGSEPGSGNLASDANGDLFGTTFAGGTSGEGTVFEIANTAGGYASSPTVLFNFDGTHGAYPLSGLISDYNGNLFGTTSSGGSGSHGTVFEIAKTSGGYATTPAILISFDGANGSGPQSGLIADADGDLFGTTSGGGAFGEGTVFEILKTSSGYSTTPTTLVNFDLNDGGVPLGGLIADSDGNLFGTTLVGGTSVTGFNTIGYGTVFEITKTSAGYDSAPVTLVNFDDSNGAAPYSSLINDASGNIFGTTRVGGTFGYGTVFEIAMTSSGYSGTPITLVNFDQADGAFPRGELLSDANGNLFGTTESGGTAGGGTVFELANTSSGYASTPTTVVNFEGDQGEDPYSGLIADFSGNLFGTTFSGGTVFELTGSGFVPPRRFAGTPGTPNCVGDSISTLAHTYGGIAHAAPALGYPSVSALQSTIDSYCNN